MAQSYELDVSLDSSGVTQGANQASNALSGLAGSAGMVSTALKTAGAAAVAFAGYKGISAAVSAAAKFEEQMLSLRSTVGESAEAVRNLRGDVMDLAAQTGQSTGDIVDGLRFARSAGLDMARTQALVETATKASAAGFGEQSDLVRTATTAMNTWSSEVQSGSDFLDTLAASAQNADVRVSEVSGAFRRNAGTAAELGLELENTLGALASISGAAGDASRGGRLLQQMLVGLQKEIGSSDSKFDDLFGSAENFRSILEDQGLIKAMTLLDQKLQKADSSMVQFFGSSRRAEAANKLVSDSARRAKENIQGQKESMDTIGKAYRNTESTLRKYSKSQKRFNNLMIKFGTSILPAVNDALRTTSNLFSTLSGNIDNVSGVVSDEFIRNLQNIENMRVGPPDVAEGNPNLITQEQFDKMENNIKSTLKLLDQAEGMPQFDKDMIRDNLETSVSEGFAQGLSGPEIVAQVRNTALQMQTRIKQGVKDGVKDGTKEGASEVNIPAAMQKQMQSFKSPMDLAIAGKTRVGKNVVGGIDWEKEADDGRQKLSRTAASVKMDFQSALAEGIRTGFDDGANIGAMLLRDLADTASRNMAQGIMDGVTQGLMESTGEETIAGMTKSGLSGLWNMMPSFFDTPGVQEVGPQGGAAQFAPGDKFVAGKSEKSMREQLGGGGGGGGTVNQTVENNFPMMSEQKIDRRIQKAAPRIADQAKRETLQAIRSGGSDGQAARNA